MEDDRLIDCGGMVVGVGGGGGGGGRSICDIQSGPRRPFNFYWNNNCIDLPQVSASLSMISLVPLFSLLAEGRVW